MSRTVGIEEYREAVIKLTEVAQQFGSGPSLAAQTLLSCYDSENYQLAVGGLRSFDSKNYDLAITVILGRHDTGQEPHCLTPSGNEVFAALKRKWSRYHVENRGKVSCMACEGRGRSYRNLDDDTGEPCAKCGGTGRTYPCGCVG
jgi:hypothetical protein